MLVVDVDVPIAQRVPMEAACLVRALGRSKNAARARPAIDASPRQPGASAAGPAARPWLTCDLVEGAAWIDGSATIRELNRSMHWELPVDGPKTLNGVILEHLEAIPEPGTSVLLGGYPVEVVQVLVERHTNPNTRDGRGNTPPVAYAKA